MNTDILERLISPWQAYFDETYKKNFYYNPQTQESLWELPVDVQERIKIFNEEYEKAIKGENRDEEDDDEEQENATSNISNQNEQQEDVQNNEDNQKKDVAQSENDQQEEQKGAVQQNMVELQNTEQLNENSPNKSKKSLTKDKKSEDQKENEDQNVNNEDNIPKAEPNMLKFLPSEIRQNLYQPEILNYMSRPARKQVDQPLSTLYSYRQGDEEYNIWYGKYLTDMKSLFKDREAAKTRCTPEVDVGYTRADLYEKYSSYFCIHFVHGCCSEGVNCKFFHRIPSIDECKQIDHTRDIFGRARHANHREDMAGVGSFMNETRTIMITEFKMSNVNQGNNETAVTQMYEVLYRHFSEWGEIEDIKLLPNKGMAFVRYRHRCLAEFAKEAMQNQALDKKEVLQIKWAQDESEVAGGVEQRENEDKQILKNALQKQHEKLQHDDKQKILQAKREQMMQNAQLLDDMDLDQYELSDTARGVDFNEELKKRQEQIMNNVEKMNAILESINQQQDSTQQNKNKADYNVYKEGTVIPDKKAPQETHPELNDQPLFFK